MKKIKIILGMLFLLSSMSFATGFQLNVAGKGIPTSQEVNGLRLNLIYGKTEAVKGVDFNLVALGDTADFKGLQIGMLGANRIENTFKGAGFGVVNIHKGDSTGLLWGLVNVSNDLKGVRFGFVNYSKGRSTVDLGTINISQSSAFQMGLFNKTDDLTGVQLGLINMAKTGFLPIFPFFNIDGRIF